MPNSNPYIAPKHQDEPAEQLRNRLPSPGEWAFLILIGVIIVNWLFVGHLILTLILNLTLGVVAALCLLFRNRSS